MTLRELLAGCSVRSTAGSLDAEIGSIAYDSREVTRGTLFVAVRGTRTDGNKFVPQAIAKGAAAIVSSSLPITGIAMPWIQVDDERAALAGLAANFFRHPTRNLHLIGVTGTNGKTTTTYLIEAILNAAGHEAAVMGTIEYRGPGFEYAAERTTPEAPDLERLFERVVQAGWKYSVMEVSSHAIELKRVNSLHFDVAVFTNLTRDHLDFHGDMRAYFLAKKRLFEGLSGGRPRVLVLNADDSHYEELRSIAPERVISYGMQNAADICPLRHHFGWNGTGATYRTPFGELEIRSSLMGTPNLMNIGAAIGAAVALELPLDAVRRGIEKLPMVPGRFESVGAGQDFRVIVDYAHTDDALDNVLKTAREITSGRLIVVFGCGGDRDRTKRPAMGRVAAARSDFAYITSDNPRSEEPEKIIQDIEEGLKESGAGKYAVCIDRRDAIRQALHSAQPGDTVLIAGKGHEPYQIIGNTTFPFDDRVVARELLDELVSGRNS
jgi:UDP-N-acetylmuramoyl-L-alanyl-D-glutamate--2,6-diaminopimelate ligase